MQSFYPPPPKQRLALAALLLLVVALHLAGLITLSGAWQHPLTPGTPMTLQWQTPTPDTASFDTTLPRKPASKPRKPRHTPADPAPGFHASPTTAPPTTDTLNTPPQTTDTVASESPQSAPSPTDAVDTAAAETPSAATAETAAPNTAPLTSPASDASVAADKTNPTAPPVVADNTTAPTWLSQARFVWPRPGQFQYEVIGESKGIRYSANGELVWQHDGNNYQMKLDISHMLLGSRTQTSVGQLGPQGLLPKRFGDKYKQEVAAHFEREKGQVVFSATSAPQALQVAAQDRLSLFAQLAALLAGSPELRQNGQQLSFQIVASKSAEVWTFQVAQSETLNLPVGSLTALKVSRLPLQNHDQTADMWLSPAHGYLPVKVRIAQANGDVLEQSLRKVVGQ